MLGEKRNRRKKTWVPRQIRNMNVQTEAIKMERELGREM